MATGWATTAANSALNTLLATYPWVKLHIGDPGPTMTANPAVETTRQQVSVAAAAGGSIANSGVFTWTNVAATEQYTHFTAWTLAAGGSPGLSGTVTCDPATAGDTVSVAIAALVASLTVAS